MSSFEPSPPSSASINPEHVEDDDGDLTDMLSELRVLLPTAQLLSAFLITVPFSAGFSSIVASDKDVFLAIFLLSITTAAYRRSFAQDAATLPVLSARRRRNTLLTR